MISSLAKAGAVLREPRYTEAAVKCAKFLKSEMYDAENNRLWRSWRKGRRSESRGYAEDYAYLIRGLLDLYETTLDPGYIEWGLKLQEGLVGSVNDSFL